MYNLRLLILYCLLTSYVFAEVPKITGTPTIITPETLLDWPQEFPVTTPYLTEPTANRLHDLHGQVGNCDIVLSTAGNYHMALRELWQIYLTQYVSDLDIKTWFYTTSPPISPAQIKSNSVQFGNMSIHCRPQVAVGPKKLIDTLINQGITEGKAVPIVKNQGNVMLVRKGNPKNIKTVWDFGREDVVIVTPNPEMESGSFGNFSGSIYTIAANDANPPENMTAETLFNSIFNGKTKWVSGKRIMHREIPWAISASKADVGVIFYHLALYFTRQFPDKFEIVPLGGTAEEPQPVAGNKVGVLKAIRIQGDWNEKQLQAREKLMDALTSDTFTQILAKHGILRP